MLKEITRDYLQNHLKNLITEKNISKINHDQGSYIINRDILKSHQFYQARCPVSLSNPLFNDSLSSVLTPPTIESPSSLATFNIPERSTATGTLLIDNPRDLPHTVIASLSIATIIIYWKR